MSTLFPSTSRSQDSTNLGYLASEFINKGDINGFIIKLRENQNLVNYLEEFLFEIYQVSPALRHDNDFQRRIVIEFFNHRTITSVNLTTFFKSFQLLTTLHEDIATQRFIINKIISIGNFDCISNLIENFRYLRELQNDKDMQFEILNSLFRAATEAYHLNIFLENILIHLPKTTERKEDQVKVAISYSKRWGINLLAKYLERGLNGAYSYYNIRNIFSHLTPSELITIMFQHFKFPFDLTFFRSPEYFRESKKFIAILFKVNPEFMYSSINESVRNSIKYNKKNTVINNVKEFLAEVNPTPMQNLIIVNTLFEALCEIESSTTI